jgi:2-polyprenyl-3-methyl-5-hydroxy-6-metoxy-1,4-benzoquinol methylase
MNTAHTSPPRPAPACPVCGAAGGPPVANVESYAIHRCRSCQLRFSHPMKGPGVAWYEGSSHYQGYLRRALRVPRWFIERDWRHKKFFSLGLHPDGKLLDIGCGTGAFLDLARARGYRVTGVDGDRGAVAIARDRYGLGDVQAVDILDFIASPRRPTHDVICLFEVLEHLENPVETLASLRRALLPDGYLVVSVPSSERWPQLYYRHLDGPPNHLTLWTTRSLEECFAAAGFERPTVYRSPLRADDLWGPLIDRLPAAARRGLPGLALKGGAEFVVGPIVVRALSTVRRAGSFTLLAVATAGATAADAPRA